MDLLLQLALVINLSFFILDAHKTFVLAGSSANMSWHLIDVVLWYFSSSLIRFLPFVSWPINAIATLALFFSNVLYLTMH